MASVDSGDVGNIDALLRAAEILEKKLYSKGGYDTADALRNISVSQFVDWLNSGEQTDAETTLDNNIASTIQVELANLIQMSGCQKVSDFQTAFGSGHNANSSKSITLSYQDDDPAFIYHPSNWKHCDTSHLRSDCISSNVSPNHYRILTAASGVSQLSESSLVGGTGDEPDGLSNTSDDVCMDNSSQDSFSGNLISVRPSANTLHALNSSPGPECNGNVDAVYYKSRLRSALLTPYSPGCEIHSNDTQQSSESSHKDASVTNLLPTHQATTGNIVSGVCSSQTSPQRMSGSGDDSDQLEAKRQTPGSPRSITTLQQQTSWSAPPSVSSSSCATPDKEFCDIPTQIDTPQLVYPNRPSRFSCSSLPVKKRKLDWKQSSSNSSDLQSPHKHLFQSKKVLTNSPSDFVTTSSTLSTTLSRNFFTCSLSKDSIPERRQSVGALPVSNIGHQLLASKNTIPLLRTCSVPVDNNQPIIDSPSKPLDSLEFHNHHPLEEKKSSKTHYQNHFSVLARTLAGSDNDTTSMHLMKQYSSESVALHNSSDYLKIGKDNTFHDNKKQLSLANVNLHNTTNYYGNISNKAEGIYTSEFQDSSSAIAAGKTQTTDLLFRPPRNTWKHRHNILNNHDTVINTTKAPAYYTSDCYQKQDCLSRILTPKNSDTSLSDHYHQYTNRSDGSPIIERKQGGLIQNLSYGEYLPQLLSRHTTKEDSLCTVDTLNRKRPNGIDEASLKADAAYSTFQSHSRNQPYQKSSNVVIHPKTPESSVATITTTTNTVVKPYFSNSAIQTDVRSDSKLVPANSSPVAIDSGVVSKEPMNHLKSSSVESSYKTLPVTLSSPSSILSNQMNVNGAHVIMMLSPSNTVPTSLLSSVSNQMMSSSSSIADTKQTPSNCTGKKQLINSSHIQNLNNFGVSLNSGTSKFPLLLVSASSSASAAALAEAAALATGAPPTSLVPVPVQVTTYVPPSKDQNNGDQRNSQSNNSYFLNENNNTSNQHFILSVMMNDNDEKSPSAPMGIRQIPLVLSAPIYPSHSNSTTTTITKHNDANSAQRLSPTSESSCIPFTITSRASVTPHQTA
ncbi:unnamed protein product [Trichobilharzia szidati]|nr:unnamed protein product [Trichobilharzia szidati]